MNYRHAYHAGNFADCMKHALLVAMLRHLRRKPAPFLVLDTHAGAGPTRLDGEAARRTNEAADGILRLLDDTPAPLDDYVGLVRQAGLAAGAYPGSPHLARALLRDDDRLVACELHPEDALALRASLAGDPRCGVHRRDGYAALGALLPPSSIRRGLVLLDPPFEQEDEFGRLAEAVARACARFPGAMVAAWYPIKHRAPVRAFHDSLVAGGTPDLVAYELWRRPPLDPARLNGSGLVVANGPFTLACDDGEDAAGPMLDALRARLRDPATDAPDASGAPEGGAGWRILRLTEETR